MEAESRKVRTVVIAEPDAGLLDLASEALTWGETRCRVIRETKGTDAYRAVQAFDPDVALLAADLPGMDGISIVRTLARQRAHRKRVFVGLVDHGDPGAARRMREAGCRDVVERPFTAGELRRQVIDALRHESTEAVGESSSILLVCADEKYRKAFARVVQENADIRVECVATGEEAAAFPPAEAPRAIVIVAPPSGAKRDLDCVAESFRESGRHAPVLLVADRLKDSELRSLPRRQALEEGPRILHLLVREREGAGNWKWSAAVHDLATVPVG